MASTLADKADGPETLVAKKSVATRTFDTVTLDTAYQDITSIAATSVVGLGIGNNPGASFEIDWVFDDSTDVLSVVAWISLDDVTYMEAIEVDPPTAGSSPVRPHVMTATASSFTTQNSTHKFVGVYVYANGARYVKLKAKCSVAAGSVTVRGAAGSVS